MRDQEISFEDSVALFDVDPGELEEAIERGLWERFRSEHSWFETDTGVCRTAVVAACVTMMRQSVGPEWFMQSDAFEALVQMLDTEMFVAAREIDLASSEWDE